jgi:hypothetical protein
MRLKKSTLSSLISFLLGAGWGIALIGSVGMFFLWLHVGIFVALLAAVLGALPGMILVLFLEHLLLKSEMLVEMKRHTRLLEKISSHQT